MARNIFITATDTGAGKTYVTAQLVRHLLAQGIHARAIKPVASGLDSHGRNEDIDTLLAAQQLTEADAINRYRFTLPASPHIAAEQEGQHIDLAELTAWCRQQAIDTDICIIEGVGGLMVPLADHVTVCDWIEAMPEAEVWLVAGARLGAINHTLLTLEKLKAIGRQPAAIILNGMQPDPKPLQQLHRTISRVVSPSQLFTLSYAENWHWELPAPPA